MLDMPVHGGFSTVGHEISGQQGSNYVKPSGSNLVKIEETQLKISVHTPTGHRMWMKNGQRTMMI